MLKILLKLWWIQKRRTFDWKRLGLFIYMMLCVIVGLGAGYWQTGGELDQLHFARRDGANHSSICRDFVSF